MGYSYLPPRLRWYEKIIKKFGGHVHDKQLFVVGEVWLVKCVECGAESIPWHVPVRLRDWAKEAHKDDVTELVKIEKNIKEGVPYVRP